MIELNENISREDQPEFEKSENFQKIENFQKGENFQKHRSIYDGLEHHNVIIQKPIRPVYQSHFHERVIHEPKRSRRDQRY